MENKAHALAAGIFVLVLTVLLVGLAAWLTRDTGERDPYEISTRETVTGLQSQAPVRYRGVDVGKVASIGFDPKATGNVLMELEVDHDAPITTDTFATLSFQGVTGLAFVQLDDTGKGGAPIKGVDGHPPRIPLKPGLISKLIERGEQIIERVDDMTARMNKVLSDDNQKKFAGALENIGNAASGADKLVQNLNTTVTGKLDPAIDSVKKTSDEIGRTASDFGQTARRLNANDGPIDRLAEGTQSLSHAADSFNSATLPRINRVTEETSRAVRQLGRTANAITDNPQALIFGSGAIAPGPGEPGFTPPGGRP